MGCKSNVKDSTMPKKNSQDRDAVNETCNGSNHPESRQTTNTGPVNVTTSTNTGSQENRLQVPLNNANNLVPTPHGQGAMHHSSTDPNFRGHRPHSAHHHRIMGRLLRAMGDGYCYSCGIALRQMGDQLSGEYEVRRAFSTGDLPNSVKDT